MRVVTAGSAENARLAEAWARSGLCELFSEHLGRPVIPRDLGLRATADDEFGLRYAASIAVTVVTVAELGRNDMRRRNFLSNGSFLAVASVAPSRDWLLATLDATRPRPRSKIGELQVKAIRDATAVFHEAQTMRGAHARRAMAQYVTQQVLPLLHDVDPDDEAGAALFAAASEQTCLLGWMSFDDGRHGLAQRYLIQSLRLAQQAGDAAHGGHVLAAMSCRARFLGHPKEALQLAIAGRHGLISGASPACEADLWAVQAHAHAALGEAREAAHAVAESERAFDRVDPDTEPTWAKFLDPACLAVMWAGAFADVGRPAETARFARHSIAAARAQGRVRTEVFGQERLARSALARRDVHAAVAAGRRAVELLSIVRSVQCTDAVKSLRAQIGAYRNVAAVREFDEYARVALSAN